MLRWLLQQLYQFNAISLMTMASLIVISSPYFRLCDNSNLEFHTVQNNLSMAGHCLLPVYCASFWFLNFSYRIQFFKGSEKFWITTYSSFLVTRNTKYPNSQIFNIFLCFSVWVWKLFSYRCTNGNRHFDGLLSQGYCAVFTFS